MADISIIVYESLFIVAGIFMFLIGGSYLAYRLRKAQYNKGLRLKSVK